jgi:hypothetical protein
MDGGELETDAGSVTIDGSHEAEGGPPPFDAQGPDAAVGTDAAASDGGADGSAGASGEWAFVSVGGEGNTPWLYTSCDGRTWTRRTIALPAGHPSGGEGSGLRGIGYGAGTFVITGGGTVGAQNVRLLGRSRDGVSWQWEERQAGACGDCQWLGGAAWLDDGNGGVWIAGGGSGSRLYSKDGGRTWTESDARGRAPYRRFRSDGARAVGAGQGVLTLVELTPASADEPVIWHDSDGPPHESVFVAAGNGAFVAVWYDDGCRFLREGTTWRTCDLPAGRDPVITSVAFGNGKFSILGHGAPIESTDGEHWTLASSGTGTDFRDVAFGNGTYVTSGSYSSDGRSWQNASSSAEHGYAQAAGRLGDGHACPR